MITMIKKFTFIFTTILLLAFILMPQQSRALTVTPAIRELAVTAGEKTNAVIQLENDGLKQITLSTEVVNFTAKGETGEPDLHIGATPTDAALWLEVSKGPIVIDAGEKVEVVVTANVPLGTTAGGYYAAVLFNFADTEKTANPDSVSIESKVAVPFLLTVKGNYTEAGSIATFATKDAKDRYASGPIGFVVRYQNAGDTHLKPVGTITIKNMFGKVVKTVKVNEEQGAVLPDSTRKFNISNWTDIGNGFGLYTATLSLNAGTIASTAQISFWLVSTTWLIILGIIVVVLIIVLILLNRRSAKLTQP